ncbi:6-bladed beta-propeller [Rhodohalobacter sp. SW132]|uniref:6-bladed beta-propeller n=1 Tax=Rhodohalobacter sp. SW132 TaxID=2293433 RepID=UPI000E23B4B4|nr:6-bladed beta-propeller [Rhodohalobacter sp. SW132]REL37781.1 6-bladed beta-propeller [Rhodohalobacter sp. SW132]
MKKLPFYEQYNLMDYGPANLRLFQIISCGVLLVLLLFSGSCSHQNQADNLPEHARDLENLIVYDSEPEPEFDINFQQTLKFGDSEDVLIGQPGRFVVDGQNKVYLSDLKQNRIHVFRDDGHYLKSIGREGEGPGEFRNISSLKTFSNMLYASDANLQRITVFSLDSLALNRTILLRQDEKPDIEEMKDSFLRHFFVRQDGTFLMSFGQPFRLDKPTGKKIPFFNIDSEGRFITDKIFELEDSRYLISEGPGQPTIGMASPFHGKPLVAVSGDDHIFSARTDEFLIQTHDSEGNYLQAFYHPFQKTRLTSNEALDHPENRFDRETFENMIENTDLPETWPALSGMFMDDEDQLWVSAIVEDFDIYEWWVLEETGELITKFEWPRNEPIEVVKNGKMYTRQIDEETGLEQVVRYRVEID